MRPGLKIKKGSSDFASLTRDGGYFVDKSLLIKEFFDTSAYTVLLTRPRRFGKSLNLSMIEHFFDLAKPESAELFEGLAIAEDAEFCQAHQNRYPVIHLSLKGIQETNWESCLAKFAAELSALYARHKRLLDSSALDDWEKEAFGRVLRAKASTAELQNALRDLSHYLRAQHGQPAVVLVDEYDAPLLSAFRYSPRPSAGLQGGPPNFYEKVANFMQGLLGQVFKGNDSNLKKGLLTGVLRVGRESIFSEWNNFDVFGIRSPYFSDSFGFTEQETRQMLEYFGLDQHKDKVRAWYNGYRFGNREGMHNPWSIVNFISNIEQGFIPYWVNTGDHSLIEGRMGEPGVEEAIRELLEGRTIEKHLRDNFVFEDFGRGGELLWTLLVENGYLCLAGPGEFGRHKLRVPNHEVRVAFRQVVSAWLDNALKIGPDRILQTVGHLLARRPADFEQGLRALMGDTLSYFDIAGRDTTPERIFHVYLLGLLAVLSEAYIVKSNRESGAGRYDILIEPRDPRSEAIIIEVKSIRPRQEGEEQAAFESRLGQALDQALEPIEQQDYLAEARARGMREERLIRAAIVLAGKRPFVKL